MAQTATLGQKQNIDTQINMYLIVHMSVQGIFKFKES